MNLAKGSAGNASVVYLADERIEHDDIDEISQNAGAQEPFWLGRRGYAVGWVGQQAGAVMPSADEIRARWDAGQGIVLPGFVASELAGAEEDIAVADSLMQRALEGEEIADIFEAEPYVSRLKPTFELLAPTVDEGDDQEIETLEFDVMENDELVAEDVWVKASWLSFDDSDVSLRFRFSFGLVGYEDVAADFARQDYAAKLTDAIFPESKVITGNEQLAKLLAQTLDVDEVVYVERIVYFNAPNGGAQMHQDVERGHAGVVYAQVTGSTAWFALSKPELIDEIKQFMARDDADKLLAEELSDQEMATLRQWCESDQKLDEMLDERDNDPLEGLINRVSPFAKQLVDKGYAAILKPGDIMLLPQKSLQHCAWHSVYCVGDEAGEALSFAIRALPK